MKEVQLQIATPETLTDKILSFILKWVLMPTVAVLAIVLHVMIWTGLVITAFRVFATPANAHEWYSQRRDPIFSQTTCCGGTDCAPLPAHAISITPDGHLRVTLTVEEARRINPVRRYGFDRVIDYDRIQISEDGQPHICLMAHDMEGDPREGYYCVFLPPTG